VARAAGVSAACSGSFIAALSAIGFGECGTLTSVTVTVRSDQPGSSSPRGYGQQYREARSAAEVAALDPQRSDGDQPYSEAREHDRIADADAPRQRVVA